MDREARIIYMGTPEFAVPPLEEMVKKGYHVVLPLRSLTGRGAAEKKCTLRRLRKRHRPAV